MEVDAHCLFADLGDCNDEEISCYSLCKTLNQNEDDAFYLGARSQMEYLLLKYGKFDMLPCNVEEFHVCTNHSKFINTTKFENCCLCKPLGRSKSSKCDLRTITKQYAYLAWRNNEMRLSFGRKMCAQCRIALSRSNSTIDIRGESEEIFRWLYDCNTTHTPSMTHSSPSDAVSQSLPNLTIKEDQEQLREFLRSKTEWDRMRSIKSAIVFHCRCWEFRELDNNSFI